MIENRIKNINRIVAVLLLVAVILCILSVITPTLCWTWGTSECNQTVIVFQGDTYQIAAPSGATVNSSYGSFYRLYSVADNTATSGTQIYNLSGTVFSLPVYNFDSSTPGTYYFYQQYCLFSQYGSPQVSQNNVHHKIIVLPQPVASATAFSIYRGRSIEMKFDIPCEGVTYQWYYRVPGSCVDYIIDGATTSSYTVVPDDSVASYYLKYVYDGFVTWKKFTFEFLQSVITVESTPSSLATYQGENVSFSISATVSEGLTASYQWYCGETAIEGATSATLNVDTSETGVYSYYCIVSDGIITEQSSNFYLTINSAVQDAIALVAPSDIQVDQYSDVVLSVSATSATDDELTYQWYQTNITCTDNNEIEGATTSTIDISTSSSGTFYYYCVVSDGTNEVISNVMTFTISPVTLATPAPVIPSKPYDSDDVSEFSFMTVVSVLAAFVGLYVFFKIIIKKNKRYYYAKRK